MPRLIFVTGRIGSGKTTYIHGRICDFVKAGKNDITLIVPEQFSFETERIMLSKLGARDFSAVSVLSFSRLADRIVPRSVKAGKHFCDDASRRALMGMAMAEVRDRLKVFKKSAEIPGTIDSMLALHGELRQNCIDTDSLRKAAKESKDNMLSGKLEDISLICDAYEAALSQSCYDTVEMLDYLYAELHEKRHFKGKQVFIDGFRGFTPQELRIIECMIRDADCVYVGLLSESCKTDDGETGLFAHTKKTERKLRALAEKHNVPIASPNEMSRGNTFKNFPVQPLCKRSPEMQALERNLYDYSAGQFTESCDNITICSASDIYAECELTAALIKKLVRVDGYRYREIAVLSRRPENYDFPIRNAFAKYGINIFEDSRRGVSHSVIFSFVDALVSIAARGFSTDSIMKYLKTGLTDVSEDDIYAVENYTYIWQIDGNKWLKEWTENPEGMGFRETEESAQLLEKLNKTRSAIIEPITSFVNSVQLCSGETFSRNIYRYLKDTGADQRYTELIKKYSSDGDTAGADILNSMWSALMNVLDSLVSLSETEQLNIREFADMWRLMTSAATVGRLPTGLDEVTVGGAERVRILAPRAVFVLGANFGVLPATPSGVSALNRKDRHTLAEMGFEIPENGEDKIAEEKLITYSTLCCSTDKLFVSYPTSAPTGGNIEPSEVVTRIKELFPDVKLLDYNYISATDPLFKVESEKSAFSTFAENINADTTVSKALRRFLEKDDSHKGKIEALDRARSDDLFELDDKKTAEQLLFRSEYFSASKIEQYYRCAFCYFLKYGLRAKTLKKAEVDVLQHGTIIHYCLEQFLKKYSGDRFETFRTAEPDLSDEIRAEVRKALDEYVDTFLGGYEKKDNRFRYRMDLIEETVFEILKRMRAEADVCSFNPVGFEVKIGNKEGSEIRPYTVTDSEGRKIKIEGSVDRVDTSGNRVRIIDYKSGGKDFVLNEILYGLNMQMLLYLFAICEDEKGPYGKTKPAGILYYPAKVDKHGSNEAKKYKMSGMFVGTDSVGIMDSTMDISQPYQGRYSEFLRLDRRRDNTIYGNILPEDKYSSLRKAVNERITNMTDSLRNGQIGDMPALSDGNDACTYCDFKGVCFYDSSKKHCRIDKLSFEDAVKMLDGEEGDSDE